jgi:hypothetical protein
MPGVIACDSGRFLPLPARGERSEFARSTRGFRVRGRQTSNAASMIQGGRDLLPLAPPTWRRPLTRRYAPTSPRKRGEVRLPCAVPGARPC